MKVVVILPTYNEKENIRSLLDAICSQVAGVKNHSFSYLVVDDTSPDGTGDVVRAIQKKNHEVFLISGAKKGLGKALLRGMQYAVTSLHAELIVQMDADLSHDPAVIPSMIYSIDKGADFVVGSRYIPGGSIPDNWGIHRKIFSKVGNAIVRFGLGYSSVHDWTGGFRTFHKKFVDSVGPEMASFSGYVFQIAFLHKSLKRGANVVEVPIQFLDRKYGKSKIAPSEYIRNVLAYVLQERLRSLYRGPFKKFAVVGSIGFLINTVILELLVVFGMHPVIGSLVGAELAITSNFFLNNSWTFNSRKIKSDNMIKKFLQFNGASVGAMLIQSGTVAVGTLYFGSGLYRPFYMIGVGIGLFWNYFMYSRVIWKKRE